MKHAHQHTTSGIVRERVRIVHHDRGEDGYGQSYSWSVVTVDPAGPALTSRLKNGLHAPVLDVDMPVTSLDGTTVTITGKLHPKRLVGALTHLVNAGLLNAATLDHMTANIENAKRTRAFRWFHWLRLHSVTLVFDYPVLAPQSKTPGHHHLLCETQMSWEDARALARGLAYAGIVDARFESINRDSDFMWVLRPVELDKNRA